PVNPSQILSTCKKFVESRRIEGDRLTRDYPVQFNQMVLSIMNAATWQDWLAIYSRIVDWELELDRYPDLGLKTVLDDQKKSANIEFGRFIEKVYLSWINDSNDAPSLSVDIIAEDVAPLLAGGKKVAFIIIDNMRLDQWLSIESFLFPYFDVTRKHYFAIIPTATPFARNAIFSGLFPIEIEQKYPDLWSNGADDDFSRNRYERQLLDFQLQEMGFDLKPEPKYIKILDISEGRDLERNIKSYMQTRLLSIVVNFVDIFSHNRSTSDILKEIVPNEAAFRSLTRSWFEHSYLYPVLRILAEEGFTVVMTSDHGSVRAMRGAKVVGDRETSTNLRYKFGRNLKCDNKNAFYIKDPQKYKLPTRGININYIVAKEDFYFVYPTNYHQYLNYYKDSFQHGGISMEEMILPVLRLDPK
ncbi:MAG TPA: PglZ domain-containing protein, partial [Bacteroidetes bacterium]|nr:PglZ domain-containing protein [Bacteroidota bacterium]